MNKGLYCDGNGSFRKEIDLITPAKSIVIFQCEIAGRRRIKLSRGEAINIDRCSLRYASTGTTFWHRPIPLEQASFYFHSLRRMAQGKTDYTLARAGSGAEDERSTILATNWNLSGCARCLSIQ
jgi:hypothetical protein